MIIVAGDIVCTAYGYGKVLKVRNVENEEEEGSGSGIYTVQISFGLLYARRESLLLLPKNSSKRATTRGTTSENDDEENQNKKRSMELNVAYEALEQMRIFNLEHKCQEMGIPFDTNDLRTKCTTCLLSSLKQQQQQQMQQQQPERRKSNMLIPLFHKARQQVAKNSSVASCLSCSSPCCKAHSCSDFRKYGIHLCLECKKLFTLDFCLDVLMAESFQSRSELVSRVMDMYDRISILLQFSLPFIEPVAKALEQKTIEKNQVGIGSSSAGMVSGALGIAAAATIFTPAGPPLLVASLLFGGSATAVSTGVELSHYYSEPTQLSHRIVALYEMLQSIVQIARVLNDSMIRYRIIIDHNMMQADKERLLKKLAQDNQEQTTALARTAGFLTGMTIALSSVVGGGEMIAATTTAEVTMLGERSGGSGGAVALRATRAASGLRFAQCAGGILSAAVLLLEARNLTMKVQSLQNGNPCAMAEILRNVKKEIDNNNKNNSEKKNYCSSSSGSNSNSKDNDNSSSWSPVLLPSTTQLEQDCKECLEVLNLRLVPMTRQEATQLIFPIMDDDVTEEEDEFLNESSPMRNNKSEMIVCNSTLPATTKALNSNDSVPKHKSHEKQRTLPIHNWWIALKHNRPFISNKEGSNGEQDVLASISSGGCRTRNEEGEEQKVPLPSNWLANLRNNFVFNK